MPTKVEDQQFHDHQSKMSQTPVFINIASGWSHLQEDNGNHKDVYRQRTTSVNVDSDCQVGHLLSHVIPGIDFDHYVVCNGRRMDTSLQVERGKIYNVVPRIPGGKGGFGSMLRAIGAQIEKTTSREACRDLSGRRMRDINNEKKLKEWLAKEADREKEQEEKRADRLARRLNPPQHKFEDSQYQEQKAKVQEDLQDAVVTGLKRAHTKGKETTGQGSSEPKKAKANGSRKEWLGMDLDSDDSDLEADPGSEEGPSTSHMSAACTSSPSHSSKEETLAHGSQTDSSQSGSSLNPESSSSQPKGGKFQTDPILVADEEEKPMQMESPQDAKSDMKPPSSLLSMLPPPSRDGTSEVKTEEGGEGVMVVKTELPEGPVDLEDYPDQASVCGLGLDRLKFELLSRGLKCGGTQEERAGRLWEVRGLQPQDFPTHLMAKAKGKGKKSTN